MIQRRDLRGAPLYRTAGGFATVALFAVLIGCGGGGDNGGGTTSTTATGTTATTGGNNTTGTAATVNLPGNPGKVDFTFLTGSGRAAGDRTAVVRRIAMTDGAGTVETRLDGERRLVLNRYAAQILDLNISLLNQASREFTTLQFDALQFESTDDGGSTTTFTTIANLPVNLDASIRTFAGRTTHVPIYLDQDVITADGTGTASFSRSAFDAINFRTGQGDTLQGTLADYMGFDITGIPAANRPRLTDGSVATRVLFSGDGYALSNGDPFGGSVVGFEPLLPGGQDDVIIGRLAGPSQIPSQGGTEGETPGTYSMVQANPSNVESITRITALQGTWREHFRQRINSSGAISNVGYLTNVDGFEMVAIPSSEDDARQDIIAVAQSIATNANGTQRAVVSNAYFGYIDYDTGRFFLYPIQNITSIIGDASDDGTPQGSVAGEVSGTISSLTNSTGTATTAAASVRNGRFTITSGGPPSGFPSTGAYVVLRK